MIFIYDIDERESDEPEPEDILFPARVLPTTITRTEQQAITMPRTMETGSLVPGI